MKRCVGLLFALMFGMVGCAAQNSASNNTSSGKFDVRNFGALGDGKTIDSPAINKAIEAANAAGGGTVILPAGDYLCYSIRLKSNVDLYLDRGCMIVAADASGEPGAPGYDSAEANAWDKYQDFGHSHWHNSLIWGEGIENVSILGPGLIWGKGLSGGRGRNDAGNAPNPRTSTPIRQPAPLNPAVSSKRPPPTTSPATAPSRDPRDTLTTAPRSGPRNIGGTPYPNEGDGQRDGVGNKAISLKNCRNVNLRDFSVLHGGHFAILATGVDNLTVDNLKLDTQRDGIDIDCCRNVRISNCSINTPTDDGICLKSSYGLGIAKSTEDVTITNCYVTGGYVEGSLLSGRFERFPNDKSIVRNGRIKFGTESNGGFKRITISNCVLDYSSGICIESVDGAIIEDVTITNIAMRDIVDSPLFIRLGNRARGPDYPQPGVIRRINVSNIVCNNANWRYGCIISGIPGHPIEDIRISNVQITYQGGGTGKEAALKVEETEESYPDPVMFGTMPSCGFYVRHVKNFQMHHADITQQMPDARPVFVFDDVAGIDFNHVRATPTAVPYFKLNAVTDFVVHNSLGMADAKEAQIDEGTK